MLIAVLPVAEAHPTVAPHVHGADPAGLVILGLWVAVAVAWFALVAPSRRAPAR
jgi:hypothetical protein